ncbi:MAG: hypothetical protein QF718_04795 [Phycisphaerales bacterium]|jgi:hypothetical protein|nr:hypothetical protein [Phycisphaerales bacterium]
MKVTEAKTILESLLENKHPVTEACLHTESVLADNLIRQAFQTFLEYEYDDEDSQAAIKEKREHNLEVGNPVNHGVTWSACDSSRLKGMYSTESDLEQLASEFGRSIRSIECELYRQGLTAVNPLDPQRDDPQQIRMLELRRDSYRITQEMGGTYVPRQEWI